MLIAVNYHHVRPTFPKAYPGIHGVTPQQFEAQLRVLGVLGVFVSGEEVRAAARGEHELPERAILITFDGGLREQVDHTLPVLRRLGVPALLFVNTGPIAHRTVSAVHQLQLLCSTASPEELVREVQQRARVRGLVFSSDAVAKVAAQHYRDDTPANAQVKYVLNCVLPREVRDALIGECFAERFAGREAEISASLYMDVDQIRELGRLGFLGTHAHEHRPLGLLPLHEAQEALHESVRYLRDWTGQQVFALSYPYGSREASAAWLERVAAAEGLELGFTMERAVNLELSTPLHLARFAYTDVPGAAAPLMTAAELFDNPVTPTWFRMPVAGARY